ncbi:hypothetical protein ASE09_15620 [Streptomyces sp. Root66D1]|nr:hypothetical protein ASD33_22520 [Streptomyces sp. Root1304]KRA80913.1 hypothetical protein ASE09_15620 [Streptomyces sp. Root66D1]
MPEHGAPESSEVPDGAEELPTTLHIAGLELSRTESPPSLACWTGYLPRPAGTDPAGLSVVTEPPAPPQEPVLRLAHDVVDHFDAYVDQALEYCRTRLREPRFGLAAEELTWLDLPELPLAVPEATVWADRTWAIRFAESRLALADPYGLLVTFDGTRPVDVQGLDEEEDGTA